MCTVFQSKSMILWNKNVTVGSHSRLTHSKPFQKSCTIHFYHAALQWCPCFVHVFCLLWLKASTRSYKLDFKKKAINGNSQLHYFNKKILSQRLGHVKTMTFWKGDSLLISNTKYIDTIFFPNMYPFCISVCIFSKQKVTLHKPDWQCVLCKSLCLNLKVLWNYKNARYFHSV